MFQHLNLWQIDLTYIGDVGLIIIMFRCLCHLEVLKPELAKHEECGLFNYRGKSGNHFAMGTFSSIEGQLTRDFPLIRCMLSSRTRIKPHVPRKTTGCVCARSKHRHASNALFTEEMYKIETRDDRDTEPSGLQINKNNIYKTPTPRHPQHVRSPGFGFDKGNEDGQRTWTNDSAFWTLIIGEPCIPSWLM